MSLEEDLMKIETQLWTEGPEAYLKHLDDRCLVAFGGTASTMSKEEVAHSTTGERWQAPDLTVQALIEPTHDSAIVTYRASATRATGETYSSLVSSGYARRDNRWKLVFHQQTPIGRGD